MKLFLLSGVVNVMPERYEKSLQEKFALATVAICGLGGLGSAIAIMLARAGIGNLILIDFDRVELTNLQRQQYQADQIGMYKTAALSANLLKIAPDVHLQSHQVRLTESNVVSLLHTANIICEAFDDAEAKAMLVNTVAELLPNHDLIAASGMAGLGNPNAIQTRKITNHFYLCGDTVSDIQDEIAIFAPRVMLCAAHQAHTVLQILAESSTHT